MQKIQIIGNVGQNAKTQIIGNDIIVYFSVAVNEKIKSNNETKDVTIWYDCSLRRSFDNISQYLTKGTRVWVDGKPVVKLYTNQAGEQKISLNILVKEFEFLGSPQS